MAHENNRIYQWYAEPLDHTTNNVLASELSEEDFLRDVCDNHGQRHSVWRINSGLVSSLTNSRSQLGLRFKFYIQEGRGQIRLANFLLSSVRRKKALAGMRKGSFPERSHAA